MLTHTSIGVVRGIISQSAAAAERGDRLVDRMHKADLLAAVGGQRQVHPAPRDEQELDDLAPLGATRMTAPLERLRSTLSDLSAEARREVQAIAMIGAGEFTAREWDAALLAAESRQTEAEPQAMAEDADLARHLSKGLYVLRLTQPAAGEHDTAASVHDPGDAVPPGVAPVEPVALTTQDRAVLGRLRDLPQRAAAPGVERGKTTLVHDRKPGATLPRWP